MYNEGQLKVASLILKNKVFSFKKEIGILSNFTFYFTAKVTGQRVMYSMGEPYHTIQLDVEVVKISGPAAVALVRNREGKIFNRVDMIENRTQNGFDYVMRDIASQIAQIFKVFDSNVSAQVENLKISENVEVEDPLYSYQIKEAKVSRKSIRDVIRDITTILKRNKEGEFYLPYELTGEEQYVFGNLEGFDIELDIRHVDFDEINSGEDFEVNSDYGVGENKLYILIQVVPDRLDKSLFSIIGKLNDDIPHELTHLKQEQEGRLDDKNYIGSPKGYFLQPHEIEAQYKGFSRAAKSMGLSVEDLVDEYFTVNQERFSLSDKEVKEIKRSILSFPKSY